MTSLPVVALAAGAAVVIALAVALSVHLLRRDRDAAASRDAHSQQHGDGDPSTPSDQLAVGIAELLAATRSGGLVADGDGRVLRATSSALTFGLVRDTEIVHPELKHLFNLVRADGRAREAEFESARGPVGAARLLIGARVAMVAEESILILIEDRTQARRVEEVRRDFVVNVSHELKTPVSGLSLLAEAVEGAADDPVAVRRFSQRMQVESQRLTRLVSEIVDLSRLQTADLMNELTVVDVATCAAEAVEHTRSIAGERTLEARVTGDRSQLRVYGDPDLIITAVRNLVTNAIAYSEDGSRVSVTTRRVNEIVEVIVSDQGRGIPSRDQERIFERFYRVDPARSRMTGGTGLGLSIVKHICSNLGGEVTLWSQEGQGSTFTIRLPAVVNDTRPVGSAVPADRRPAQRKVAI